MKEDKYKSKYEFGYELDDNNLIVRLKNLNTVEPTIVRTDDISKWCNNKKNLEISDAVMFAIHSLVARELAVNPSEAKLQNRNFYTVIYKYKGIYYCKIDSFDNAEDINKEVSNICRKLSISLKDIEVRKLETTKEVADKYMDKTTSVIYKGLTLSAVYKGFLKKYLYVSFFDKEEIAYNKLHRSYEQKKYCFTFYNYLSCSDETGFVVASDMHQAKQLAVLFMRFRCGDKYDADDISCIYELNDSYFYSLGDIKAKYEALGKQFEMPEIIEEEDEYDD